MTKTSIFQIQSQAEQNITVKKTQTQQTYEKKNC
jgi:hypothetical protein